MVYRTGNKGLPGRDAGAISVALGAVCLVAMVVVGCAKDIADPISGDVDFANPKSVVGSIFYAAQTGDIDHLASLCDPQRANSPSTQRICDLTPASAELASFRAAFRDGRLNGEPRVSGDSAAIKILYGKGGAEVENVVLVRRDGRWYLSSL